MDANTTLLVTATSVGVSDVGKANIMGTEQGPETVSGGKKHKNKTNNANIKNKVLCLVNVGKDETRLGYMGGTETPTKITRTYKKARRFRRGKDSMFLTAIDRFLTTLPYLEGNNMGGVPKITKGDRASPRTGGGDEIKPDFLEVLDSLNKKRKMAGGQGGPNMSSIRRV